MSHRIKVSRRASLQIRTAAVWWQLNRPKAPSAFGEEIERGFDLASRLPSAGERVEHPRHSRVRRVLLGRIRYYLYYQIADDFEAVEILSLWHSSRGTEPDLG